MCSTLKMIDPGDNQANGDVDSSVDMVTSMAVCEDDRMNEARSTVDQAVGATPLVGWVQYSHQLAKPIQMLVVRG